MFLRRKKKNANHDVEKSASSSSRQDKMMVNETDDYSGHIPPVLQSLQFTHVPGSKGSTRYLLFALSTCGFCRKGLQFLNDNDVSYDYIYVDKLAADEKKSIRDYVTKTFNTSLTYPFLVINDKKWISGFLRVEWQELIKHG